jgi:hypothetical protein
MIIYSITCEEKGFCRIIYELRRGPRRYVGYLQDGQHVIEADNDEEASEEFIRMFNLIESTTLEGFPTDTTKWVGILE